MVLGYHVAHGVENAGANHFGASGHFQPPRRIKAQQIELVLGVMDQQSGADSILSDCQYPPLLLDGWRLASSRTLQQFLCREPLAGMAILKPKAVHRLAEGVGAQGGYHSVGRVAFAGLRELMNNRLVKRVQPPKISRVDCKRRGLLSQRVVRVELLGLQRWRR